MACFDCGLFDFPIKSQTEKKEKKIHHIKARDGKYSTCFLVIHQKKTHYSCSTQYQLSIRQVECRGSNEFVRNKRYDEG